MKISANSCNFLQCALDLQSDFNIVDFNALLQNPTCCVAAPHRSLFNCLTAIYYSATIRQWERLRHSRSSRCLNSIWHGNGARGRRRECDVWGCYQNNEPHPASSSVLISHECIWSAVGSAVLHAVVHNRAGSPVLPPLMIAPMKLAPHRLWSKPSKILIQVSSCFGRALLSRLRLAHQCPIFKKELFERALSNTYDLFCVDVIEEEFGSWENCDE